MITLTLNENDAKVLLTMIDIAVKATGLQGAEAGVFFNKMIMEQLNNENTETQKE